MSVVWKEKSTELLLTLLLKCVLNILFRATEVKWSKKTISLAGNCSDISEKILYDAIQSSYVWCRGVWSCESASTPGLAEPAERPKWSRTLSLDHSYPASPELSPLHPLPWTNAQSAPTAMPHTALLCSRDGTGLGSPRPQAWNVPWESGEKVHLIYTFLTFWKCTKNELAHYTYMHRCYLSIYLLQIIWKERQNADGLEKLE